MDYLVLEGYQAAAEEFSKEANVIPPVDFNSIETRMTIREAVQRGDVEEAIELVNDLNPEILETNPKLHFHLQQQRLIEHIRHGRTDEALNFAAAELAPRGEDNPDFLRELERTMTLLAFNSAGTGASAGAGASAPANIAELLTPAQRAKTAGELNTAILESMSQGKEAKLAGLIRLMAWGENMLESHDVEFPKMEFPIESEWEGDEGNVKTSA